MSMRRNFLIILIITLLLLPISVGAAGFERFDTEASITGDNIVNYKITMKFDEPLIRLNYPFNLKIKNLTISNNFGETNCKVVERGKFSDAECEFSGMTEAKKTVVLGFYTDSDVIPLEEKRRYGANYFAQLPINKTSFLLRLPDRGALSEQPTNTSYYPEDGSVRTDGRYILVYWEKENIKSGDTLTFSASYTITGGEFSIFYNTIALLIIILVIVIGGAGWLVFRHKGLTKKDAKELIVSVLDKDEKAVYDILVNHSGSVGQKVIVRESNFSKAKVSRVVKRLVKRNIVITEPISGRENRIILKQSAKQGQLATETQKTEQPTHQQDTDKTGI